MSFVITLHYYSVESVQTVHTALSPEELILHTKTYYLTRHVYVQLECGPMPNVMAALPNTSGALCSTPQNLTDAHC